MNNNLIETLLMVTMIVFAVTIVVGMGISVFVFYLGKNAAFKRKWFPWFGVLTAVALVFFVSVMTVLRTRDLRSLRMLAFVVPAMVIIWYFNSKVTKFCDGCGATVYNYYWPIRRSMKFCAYCGAELVETSSVPPTDGAA